MVIVASEAPKQVEQESDQRAGSVSGSTHQRLARRPRFWRRTAQKLRAWRIPSAACEVWSPHPRSVAGPCLWITMSRTPNTPSQTRLACCTRAWKCRSIAHIV